jgi:hypothetical protein
MSSNQMPLDSEDDSSVTAGTRADYIVDPEQIEQLRADLEDAGHTHAQQHQPRNQEDALAFTLVGMVQHGLTKLFKQPGPIVESELDRLKHFKLPGDQANSKLATTPLKSDKHKSLLLDRSKHSIACPGTKHH